MNDYLDFDGLVVYTGGTFDLFHAGHVNFLKRCKEIAGELGSVVVSLNTDEFIKEYKGKPPVVSFSDRMAVLKACKYVDQVIANSGGADSKPTILQVSPNIIAIGTDWARKDYYKQMQFTQDWLDEKDMSLIYIPYTKGISSTEIKTRL
jgi:glycerol-3-phosphate cytidylyltransferase